MNINIINKLFKDIHQKNGTSTPNKHSTESVCSPNKVTCNLKEQPQGTADAGLWGKKGPKSEGQAAFGSGPIPTFSL